MLDFLLKQTPFLYLTQSLWRDEAFSVLIAQNSPWEIIKLTAHDFNPPLYYLILRFWMNIFGNSEISIRSLSFIFHLILIYVTYKFAKKISPSISQLLTYLATFLVAFNPMLLYYAFEARMYSLLALLATLSMYHFYQKNWRWYLFFTTAGLYTQPFMIFVLLSQILYLLIIDKEALWRIFVKKLALLFLFFLPWIFVIFNQLKQSGPMWIYPVDFNLLTSVLGNLFLGFEGTPPFLWNFTKILSLIILIFSLKALKNAKTPFLLFFLWSFFPLSLVLFISFFKPIYVNRYLIFVTVGEIFLIVLGLQKITSEVFQKIFVLCFLFFVFCFNFWYAPYHQKTDFRLILLEISQQLKENDIIVSETPLSFFEVNYYYARFAKERPKTAAIKQKVFLYNPKKEPIPAFLGATIIPKERWLTIFPKKRRVFLIHNNGTYSKIES